LTIDLRTHGLRASGSQKGSFESNHDVQGQVLERIKFNCGRFEKLPTNIFGELYFSVIMSNSSHFQFNIAK
jgi:hypothetical protein